MGQLFWARLIELENSVNTVTFLTPNLIKMKKNTKLKFGVKELDCQTNQLIVRKAEDLNQGKIKNSIAIFFSRIITGIKSRLGPGGETSTTEQPEARGADEKQCLKDRVVAFLINIKKIITSKLQLKKEIQADWIKEGKLKDLNITGRKDAIIVFMTTDLAKRLGIPLNLTYQVHLEDDSITIGPTIGLLLGTKKQNYTPEFMTEHYSNRMRICSSIGGIIVAYSTAAVNWNEQTVSGLLYRPDDLAWVPITTTIPKVNYRRHIFQPKFSVFRSNLVKQGGIIFNSNRFSKWQVHQILEKNPLFMQYLPETILPQSYDKLVEFIKRHPKIILKPKTGSMGNGILIIERQVINDSEEQFILADYRSNQKAKKQTVYSRKTLKAFLDKLAAFESNKYICQKFIDLATVNGSIFDIRILMQKGKEMTWHISGIACRIANSNKKISNLAAGGKAIPIEKLVDNLDYQISLENLTDSLNRLCSEFCFWMDQRTRQHYAEFGLDVGLAKNGSLWFIEANFRPGFKGFKTFDHDIYLEIGYQPFRYATAIQGFYVNEQF